MKDRIIGRFLGSVVLLVVLVAVLWSISPDRRVKTVGKPSWFTMAPAPAVVSGLLPDSKLTPGDVLPVVAKDVCVSGYSKGVRNVPESEKQKVYLEYGITSHLPHQYEVDHLISLELGGSNDVKN